MTPKWYCRDLTGGETGRDVRIIQRLLYAPATGVFDDETRAYIRGVQQANGLVMDGTVNQTVAELIGESVESELPPDWFHRNLKVGCQGDDVQTLHELLHLPFGDLYTEETRKAVLRFQSANHLPLTGRVTRTVAELI